MDKILDIIKWVDSGFKLLVVILLGVFIGSGWFLYQIREDILGMVKPHPELYEADKAAAIVTKLLKEVGAEGAVVHKIDVINNERNTFLAIQSSGLRYAPLENLTVSLFNSGKNKRNKATIGMLNGNIYCAPFKSSSKAGKWMDMIGVKYMCRGPIPPRKGHLHGYIAVGFKAEPEDLVSVKSRILIAGSDLVK